MTTLAQTLDFWNRVPTPVLALAAAAAVAGWAGLHRLAKPSPSARRFTGWALGGLHHAALPACRALTGFAGLWLAMTALGRVLLLKTTWPIWPVAMGAAVLTEALVALYRLERTIVSRRAGAALTGLRISLAVLLALMLLQPVWVSLWTETRRKTVAVLVDVSASMQIPDAQMPAHSKLRLAEAFSLPAARRPWRLEEQVRALRDLGRRLQGELDRLNMLANDRTSDLKARLANRRPRLHTQLADAVETLGEQLAPLGQVVADVVDLPAPAKVALRDARAALAGAATDRLRSAVALTDKDAVEELPAQLDRLRGDLRAAVAELGKAVPAIDQASAELDALLYAQLSDADRAAIDAVGRFTRAELARAVLLHRPARTGGDGDDSLLSRLAEQYAVRVYTFASAPAETETASWADPTAAAAATAPASRPGERPFEDTELRTDLAGALKKALMDAGGEELAGVIALTDGQDNGKGDCEPLIRQLAAQGAAFCAVAFGAIRPPVDAAIISVDCPDTVFKEDRMYVDAELKLDGLSGRTVRATLHDGKRVVATKDIPVNADVLRQHIQLADEPKTAGVHDYRIEVKPLDAGGQAVEEVFPHNNAFDLTLTVTEDRTRLLLIDGRPRWEYRYLCNLFRGRDKTVKLQHVLIHPDTFAGQPEPAKPTYASATRPLGQEEATDLPEKDEDWMKFDVIILGDLTPDDLGPRLGAKDRADPAKSSAAKELAAERMKILRRFVADRGGSLILIAGDGGMPGAFAGTELAELIPLELAEPDAKSLGDKGFRIAPTPTGADHVVLRQDVDPEQSKSIWKSLQPVYWHSPYLQASPRATVLAYALAPDAPKWLTEADPATEPAGLEQRRRKYQQSHALISVAGHGLGKVMVLGFDRTWRLRYRAGDTRHHKFWGQVVRWATEGKLPAGTELVKLGTDRTRYPPRSRAVVRAKIVESDYRPVISDQVSVKVLAGKKVVGRFPMRYLPDSSGMYTATLDELPAGSYRLELDAPEARAGGVDGTEPVATTISVDPSTPQEQVELACNRDLLSRLAGSSDGGAVLSPEEARSVLTALPAGKVTQAESAEFAFWDSWLLLGLFCTAVTAEWILRKRVGLT